MGIKTRVSFTLIEILIVLAVVGFSLPLLITLFLVLIQSQYKLYALREMSSQGSGVIRTIKHSIQSRAASVVNDCPNNLTPTPILTATPFPSITFIDNEGETFGYFIDNEKIASSASNMDMIYLTNDKVRITRLGFSCYKTNIFSSPLVFFSFDVMKKSSQIDLGSSSTLTFQSYVKLKKY